MTNAQRLQTNEIKKWLQKFFKIKIGRGELICAKTIKATVGTKLVRAKAC